MFDSFLPIALTVPPKVTVSLKNTMNFAAATRAILIASFCALATACGSGSSGGGEASETETDSAPTVLPQSPEQTAETPSVTPQVALPELSSDGSMTLAAGEVITGSLLATQEAIIRVPSGAEIILTSDTGDVDLFLITEPVFSNAALVCSGFSQFLEHNCSATVDDGELYASVFAREDSTFTLTATNDCSVPSVNEWVNRNMLDYYLYSDLVPNVNPALFNSPEELVRELRFNQLDPFSNVQDAATQEEFTETGGAFGFGFRSEFDGNGNLRVTRVYDDSPFGRAGIVRGDIIVSIEGVPVNELSDELAFELLGDRDNPLEATWEVVRGASGLTEFIPVTIGELTANTVIFSGTFSNPAFSGTVGYLVFESFIRTSEQELDAAIADLRDAGVTELVLDLRYNGGGLISIANRLASQIAGPPIAGETLVRYEFNDKYTDVNFDFNALSASPSLDLDRVLVLTTAQTASASELVINALQPFMEVVTFGQRTLGKPFISAPKLFCGKSLNAMEAEGVNSIGVTVAGGVDADCFAADDLTRDYGNRSGSIEGMLGSSLDYLLSGTCDASPTFAKRPDAKLPPFSDKLPMPSAVLDSRQ